MTTIRRATASDALDYLALERRFFPGYAPEATGTARDTLRFALTLKAAPADKQLFFTAADDDGHVVGLATAKPFETTKYGTSITHHTGPLALLSQVAVREDHRRQGLGARLVDTVLGALSEQGFAVALAHVPTCLTPWYDRQGWTVLPERHGFAWVELPGPRTEQFSPPDWSLADRMADTPRFAVVPDGRGYDRLVVADLGIAGSRFLLGVPFPLGTTTAESTFNSERAIVSLTLRVPGAGKPLSRATIQGLFRGGLTDEERKRWPDGWESVRDKPFD